jgi:hypothetical protein
LAKDLELVTEQRVAGLEDGLVVPSIIADAGDGAAMRFIEFFTAQIHNPNTR